MESTFLRLLGSLEDLTEQETLQLAAGDIAAVRQIQERADPVVEELARFGRHAIPAGSRDRVAALMDQRLQNQARLNSQVSGLRDALGRTRANLARLGQIAPVYGHHASAGSALASRVTRAMA